MWGAAGRGSGAGRVWAHVGACQWAETSCVMVSWEDWDISASFLLREITRCLALLVQTLGAGARLGVPRTGPGTSGASGFRASGPQLGLVRAMNWGQVAGANLNTPPPKKKNHSNLILH